MIVIKFLDIWSPLENLIMLSWRKEVHVMRIVKEVEIEGKRAQALLDTGSFHTYVTRRLLEGVPMHRLLQPFKVALGGKEIEVKERCLFNGKIEGLDFSTWAIPIDELGAADGKTIDALIGASTMEEWEIIPNPRDGMLDLSGLRRREFTEYLGLELASQ